MLRALAVIVGCLIVAATAHVNIVAAGDYAAATAPLTIAVALGLCVGSICIGVSWADARYVLAVVIAISLLAGEAFAIIRTSERTIAERDAIAAPIDSAAQSRASAVDRIAKAETAKTTADTAAITEAAKPGCRRECRILLEGAKADAARELAAARAELNALPAPRSAAPLADRLHIAGWTLDLITAALASIAVNGLGGALIAFGAHGKSRVVPQPIEAVTARGHAASFGLEMMAPADASTPVTQLHTAYLDWCRRKALVPFAPREIGTALIELFERTGVEIADIGGRPHVMGAVIRSVPQRRFNPTARIGVHA